MWLYHTVCPHCGRENYAGGPPGDRVDLLVKCQHRSCKQLYSYMGKDPEFYTGPDVEKWFRADHNSSLKKNAKKPYYNSGKVFFKHQRSTPIDRK